MQHKIRRMLALMLVAILLVTMIPVNAICVDASTIASTEVLSQPEHAEEKASTEQSAKNEDTSTGSTEEIPGDEQIATEELLVTSESVTTECTTVEDATEWKEQEEDTVTTENIVGMQKEDTIRPIMLQSIQQKMALQQSRAADKAPLGVILSAGTWAAGHFKWYVNTGDISRHYIFCMEKGKAMSSGIFKPTKYSGVWGSAENTFRIAIAMDYFKKHGGWSSEEGYVDAQNVIWNQGGTQQAAQLMNYSNYLWKLTECNTSRSSGSDSFSNALTAISEQDVASKDARSKITANAKKLPLTGKSGYEIDTTIKLSGAAWKYFAGKTSMGSIVVDGCYDVNGKKLEDGVAKVSVDTNGNLGVKMKQHNGADEIATSKNNAAFIILKVNPSYEGATQIDYLQTSYSQKNQTLAYDASFHSPAYFAIRVYASSTTYAPTGIYVNKIDEFGKEAEGAEFLVQGVDSNYLPIFSQSVNGGGYVEIDRAGSYTITETVAPKGMRLYTNPVGSHVVATFHVEERTQNGTKTLAVVADTSFEGVTARQDENGLAYWYTIPNEYEGGDAVLHKIGNVLVSFADGKYIYQKKALSDVTFALYAAEDIYLQNELLFSADQQLTNEVVANTVWMQSGKHHTQIDEKTDLDGNLNYKDLPVGKYYVIEQETPYKGYWLSRERLSFYIVDNADTDLPATTIHSGDGYMNEAIPARCMVIKENEEQQRLQGAEFTIYANIKNTDYEGNPLFRADQTSPVMVWSENGVATTVENEWIPLETMMSDANGEAYFDMELPYGHYLVAETNPPEDAEQGKRYANATETYEFWHTAENMEALASGALFTHTFVNQEKANFILIRKTGEQLAKAVTEQTEYGPYQKLVFENQAAEGVVFQIKDAAGNLVEELVTDQTGVARSSNLKPGTYYVKEISNQGQMQLDTQEKKVIVKEDSTQTVNVETIDFLNSALNTQLQIHKQAEIAKASTQLPLDDVSHADHMYEYSLQAIQGVVFGIYAKTDIKDKNDNVVVKAGSCMGYCTTNEQGIATFDERLVSGEYYYQEVRTADDSYQMDATTYPFTMQFNGEDIRKDLNGNQPVINEKYKGGIKVIKTDSVNQEALSGVRFRFYDADKNVLGILITDENGEITVGDLPVGTYYLEEIQTVQGYRLDSKMHEIVLKQGMLHLVLNISNDKEEESVVPNEEQQEKSKSQSSKSGKHVKTGDWLIRYILCILVIGITLTGVWYKRKKLYLLVKRMKHLWMLFLFGILVCIPGYTARAGAVESLKVTSATIIMDGKSVAGNVTFEQANGGYRMRIESDYGTYVSLQSYQVGERVLASDQREYVLRPINSNGTSFALAGSRNGQQIRIPEQLQVSCRLEYYNKENIHYADTVQLAAMEVGDIRQIQYYQGMNVIIPENCGVQRIGYGERPRQLTIYDIMNMGILCYKKDVYWDAGNIQKAVVDSEMYQRIQNAMQQNMRVYYGTPLAEALSVPVTIADSGQKSVAEPAYFTGKITYHTNGGSLAQGSEVQEYVQGKEHVLAAVSRKDYVFEGWYYDAGFREDKKVPLHTNGESYLPADVTTAADCEVYAKWNYNVVLQQNGITYRITTQKVAVVIANENAVEAVIPASVTYGGQQYPVTSITADAFANASIVTIRIAKTVNEIADQAFCTCVNLKDVYIDSMTMRLGTAFDKKVNLFAYATSQAYRQYEEDGYTGKKEAYASQITYVLNGGKNAEANVERYEWKSNLVLEPAVKEGYRFDGWYMDSGFQPEALVEHICADEYADIVLYAKFTSLHGSGNITDKNENVAAPVTAGDTVKNPETKITDTATASKQAEARTSSATKPWIKKIQIRIKRRKVKLVLRSVNTRGYCIEYATNKKLKRRKTIYISKDKYTFTKWKKGKKYYMRIRPFNYDSEGRMVYGDWTRRYKLTCK